jgi:hypothetical protein
MSLFIEENHRMHPKRFLSLWYVWRKPCRYLAPTQTLSPNRPKWDSIWPTSPRSSIGCIQNDFWAYGMFGGKPCTFITLCPNRLNQAFTWASSPRRTIGCVQNDFWAYGMFDANSGPILHRHEHYLQTDQNENPHDPRHPGVPSGVSQTFFEPMARSAQTVHLSCVRISTISKQTKSSFHLILIT